MPWPTSGRRWPLAFAGWLTAALVAAWVGAAFVKSLPPPAARVPLPDGTYLRVEGLTWGSNQVLRLEPPVLTLLRAKLGRFWPKFLGSGSDPVVWATDGIPARLWFSHFDPATGVYLPLGSGLMRVLDGNGRSLSSSSSSGVASGRPLTALDLEAVDWRAERLDLRVEAGDRTHPMSLPNPRSGERFPIWGTSGLPQTRVEDGFQFTFRGLESGTNGAGLRCWSPSLTVAKAGAVVDSWFDLDWRFTDPTGNRSREDLPASEPAWRLEVSAYPAPLSPLLEKKVIPLARSGVPGDGEHRSFEPSQGAAAAGVLRLVYCGPGAFGFSNGVCTSARPLADGEVGNSSSASSRGAGSGAIIYELRITQDHAALWVVLRAGAAGTLLMPAETDRTARLAIRFRKANGDLLAAPLTGGMGLSSGSEDRWNFFSARLPADAKAGDLQPEIMLLEPIRVEFTFPAPGRPNP